MQIPIAANSKRPLVKWQQFQQTPADEATLTTWHQQYPGCNWALITGAVSGVIVLDVDARRGGEASLRGRHLPPTRTTRTPGGGVHYYYQRPSGTVPCVPDILPGCDLKADGGYVLVPPSSIDGRAYEVVLDAPEAPAPAWLTTLLRAANRGSTAGLRPKALQLLGGVGEGQRNETCARLAGRLLAYGMPQSEVIGWMLLWNQRNRPPLPAAEVRLAVRSIGATAVRRHLLNARAVEV